MIRTARPGFSVAELLIVVLFVGVLARIAMPSYQKVTYRARAAQALGDINAVRVAAYAYNTETNRWPADRYPGEVPPELVPYLGDGFTFQRNGFQLDWENWVLPDGTPKHPETGVLLGVSLTTTDERLGAALEAVIGTEGAHYTLGNNYTFVVASL